ncbi:MAG: DUF3857 domain-containing protein, partial [Acidobacteriota bacterium]
ADPAALRARVDALTPPADAASRWTLLRSVTHRIERDGRQTIVERRVILVRDAAGAGELRLQMTWDPTYQAPPTLRARVIDRRGTVRIARDAAAGDKGDARDVEHLETSLIYQPRRIEREPRGPRRTRVMPVGALEIGDLIEQQIVLRDQRPSPFGALGTAGAHALVERAPVRHSRVTFDIERGVPLRYGVRLVEDLAPRRAQRDGRLQLIFDARDLAPAAPEPSMPDHLPRTPSIAYGTGESWATIADALATTIDQALDAPDAAAALDALRAEADRRAARADSSAAADDAVADDETLDAIAPVPPPDRIDHLLAAVRAAVAFDGRGVDARPTPRDPAAVIASGTGSSLDLAVVTAGLLRAEGRRSAVVLLRYGDGGDLESGLPGFDGHFNHAVVRLDAADGGAPRWLDPSHAFARAGDLPALVQGRLGLALTAAPAGDEDRRRVRPQRTPSASSRDNRSVEIRTIRFADAFGSGAVAESSAYHGAAERQQRVYTAGTPDAARRDGYRTYLQASYLAEGEPTRLDETAPDELGQRFRIELAIDGAARVSTDLREAAIAVPLSMLASALPPALLDDDAPRARQHDFVYRDPFVVVWHYRIVPPADFVFSGSLAPVERQIGTARLRERYNLRSDGSLDATFHFDSGHRRLRAAEFITTRDALRAFLAEPPRVLRFVHVARQARSAGDAAAAMRQHRTILERLAASGDVDVPQRAMARVRYALDLLAVGLGDAARAQIAQAAALGSPDAPLPEPIAAMVDWARGSILQHDALGRSFGPGSDLAAARGAVDDALAHDPSLLLAQVERAFLLEHGPDGARFGPGADLDAAIAHYRTWRQTHGPGRLDDNLMALLLHTGRWTELEPLVRSAPPGIARAVVASAVAAVRRGPEAAQLTASRAGSEVGTPARILNSAAGLLVRARRYAPASALLERASSGLNDPDATMARAALLRGTRRLAVPLAPALDDPDAALRRLLAVLADGAPIDRLEPLVHPSVSADPARAPLADLLDAVRALPVEGFGDLPPSVRLDMLGGALRTEVVGDTERGWWVDGRAQLGGRSFSLRAFFLPDPSGPRLVAFGSPSVFLGRWLLGQLGDGGDLDTLRQWLDWSHEMVSADAAPPTAAPVDRSPFLQLWRVGRGAGGESAKQAAAALALEDRFGDDASAMRRDGRDDAIDRAVDQRIQEAFYQAAGQGQDGVRRLALERALLTLHVVSGRSAQADTLGSDLMRRAPDGRWPFWLRARAVADAGAWDGLALLAATRLADLAARADAGDDVPAALLRDAHRAIAQGAI